MIRNVHSSTPSNFNIREGQANNNGQSSKVLSVGLERVETRPFLHVVNLSLWFQTPRRPLEIQQVPLFPTALERLYEF